MSTQTTIFDEKILLNDEIGQFYINEDLCDSSKLHCSLISEYCKDIGYKNWDNFTLTKDQVKKLIQSLNEFCKIHN